MNMVLWLREKAGIQKKFGTGNKSTNLNSGPEKAGNYGFVFTLLPSGKRPNVFVQASSKVPTGIFVAYPQNPYLRNQGSAIASLKRKSFISAAALSFICFIAVIFIAIGMLNLIISSFKLQAYSQGYLTLEQTAHKPGSGPSAQDAVINEYQHALTRERIAAADTSPVTTAGTMDYGKGILEQITVEEATDAATLTGASRKIKIYNGTTKTLDRVVVQIDILDKAGHLLHTEYHTAKRIASLGTKVIELQTAVSGAAIRCYVQEVRSKSLRTSLRSL